MLRPPYGIGRIVYTTAVRRSCPSIRCAGLRAGATLSERQEIATGDCIPLTCSRLAHSGQGVGFWSDEGRRVVVFCVGALPGESVMARVAKSFPYQEQINAKQDRLRFELRQIAKVADVDAVLQPIIQAPEPLRYRNKTTFTVTPTASGPQLALQKARTNDVHGHICVASCLLQSEQADELLSCVNAALRDPAFAQTLTAFDAAACTGFLKRCIIQEAVATGGAETPPVLQGSDGLPPAAAKSFRVNWVTHGTGSRRQQQALAAISQHIHSTAPVCVSGLVQSVHSHVNISAPVDSVRVLCGEDALYAHVSGLKYRLLPQTFFQVNSRQTEVLFSEVVKAADVSLDDVVLDLYCGSGALALQMSGACAKVVGVDIVPAAIEDAKVNADLNGCTNVSFHAADLRAKLGKDRKVFKAHVSAAKAHVVVVDPGRAGLSDAVKRFIAEDRQARRVVYVSCNSETMCRDIRAICAEGSWRCSSAMGLDQFPQTDHMEQIAVLQRCSELSNHNR